MFAFCAEFRYPLRRSPETVEQALLPGAKLSAISLYHKWKVSRTPVREILRRLEAEGLIALPQRAIGNHFRNALEYIKKELIQST